MGKKKLAGERLDRYYHLAKDQGYRARSAFKLVQLSKKYEFLQNAQLVVDLCAAPGGWAQVAQKYMPVGGRTIAVDLNPIRPIAGVTCIQADITTGRCRDLLRKEIQQRPVDVVLHDGAPNVRGVWAQDAYNQAELTLQSCRLASQFLKPGGSFVTKVFRSQDYNTLLWVFHQLFRRVEATKPLASRQVSAEIFVVCKDYLAPKKIDPRLFDPSSVFQECSKTLNPRKSEQSEKSDLSSLLKTRQKSVKKGDEGYEEGDDCRHPRVSEFFSSNEPAGILVRSHGLILDDLEIANDETTTEEIKNLIEDVRVLSKGDLQKLLRWRSRYLKKKSVPKKKDDQKLESVKFEESEELRNEKREYELAEEMDRIFKNSEKRKKQEKRKSRELKKKMEWRKKMSMQGLDPEDAEEADLFRFDEKKFLEFEEKEKYHLDELRDLETDEEVDLGPLPDLTYDDLDEEAKLRRIEEEEDYLYRESKENQVHRTKERRKKKLTKKEKEIQKKAFQLAKLENRVDEELEAEFKQRELEDLSSDEEEIEDWNFKQDGVFSEKDIDEARLWYNQEVFSESEESEEPEFLNDLEDSELVQMPLTEKERRKIERKKEVEREERKKERKVKREKREGTYIEDPELEAKKPIQFVPYEKPDLFQKPESTEEIAEIQALGKLLINKKSRMDLIDGAYNRWTFEPQTEDLPQWFVDDENEHCRAELPITKELAAEYRKELREINARPIRKVAEAKARQRKRMVRRLEEVRKKAANLDKDETLNQRSKAREMRKAVSKSKRDGERKRVTVVSRRSGGGRTKDNLKHVPKGSKLKVVDRRMKKDKRAEKRRKKR